MRCAVSLAVLFALAVPAPAVPIRKGGPVQLAPLSDKYFPDNAVAVAVLNVRQVVAAPEYRKALAKQLGELLRDEKVAAILKDFGLDPLKDIDRICAVMGRSGQENNRPVSAPFLLVEGRFDLAKIAAGANKLAKATTDHGKAKIYELPGPNLYAAVLDKHHFVLAEQIGQVQEALDKAEGKKKTVLKYKALAEMLGKIKPEESLSAVATGDMVVGGGISVANGVTTVTVHTLADTAGIQALTIVANIKNDVRVKATMTATDADKAKEIEKTLTNGIQQALPMIEKVTPDFAMAMKNVKISRKDRTLTLEGQGPGHAVRDLIYGWFTLRSSGVPRP
jgi:hypothetical protein